MPRKRSNVSNDYNKLLKKALKNPGVQEVSKFYENYHEVSKQIHSFSAGLKPGSTIITSNSSS